MKSQSYKDAGVDIDIANEFVDRIKPLIKKTFKSSVLSDIGGFGGLFSLNILNYRNPVLVSSTDGVGTKLNIAFQTNRHDTIGIDLVAMCVNDIIVQGAEPLFMLDYISTSKIDIVVLEQVVIGITEGCKAAGCSLIGGETAEMPDFFKQGEYDVAGFTVGIVEKEKIIDGSNIRPRDVIIGIGSSGLHSNGYSLVRNIIFKKLEMKIDDIIAECKCTVGEELLKPTKIYVNTILNLLRDFNINGMANITGGGIAENLVRILPDSCKANIDKGSWEQPPIFSFLKDAGNVKEDEMLRIFNNGIGMILVVRDGHAPEIMHRLKGLDEKAWIIGRVSIRKEGGESVVIN